MIRSIGFNFHRLLGEIDGNSKQQIRYSSTNVNRGKCQSGGFAQASPSRSAYHDCSKSGNNRRSKSIGKNPSKSRSENNSQRTQHCGQKTSRPRDIKHNFAHIQSHTNARCSGKACCKSSDKQNSTQTGGTKAIARASEIRVG